MIEIKLGEAGLRKVLREWQEIVMNVVWETTETKKDDLTFRGIPSRYAWEDANNELGLRGGKSISRASVINFLNAMCDYNVILFLEETCKGGSRRTYRASTDREGFVRKVIEDIFESFQDYPLQLYTVVKDHYPTVQ